MALWASAGSVSIQTSLAQVQADAPEWPAGLVSLVRLPAGMDRDREALQLLVRLGVSGVALSPGQDPEPARQAGLVCCQDVLVGAGRLQLRESEREPLRSAYEHGRDAACLQPPHCLCEPATRGELLARAATALDQWGDAPPCAVILADAASTTHRIDPLDVSFSGAALAQFRLWLRSRYQDLAALNGAWHGSFASFDDVMPCTVDGVLARDAILTPGLPSSLAAWGEHRTFMDTVLGSTVQALARCTRAKLAVPCGLTAIQPPAAYGGADFGRLLPALDLFEVADVGGARDLAMALARRPARQLRRIVSPGPDGPTVLAQVADALAHGMAGVLMCAEDPLVERAEDGPRPTAFGTALATALQRARGWAPFAGARLLRSPVWIVESQPAVQVHWMLDAAPDGAAWIERTSADEIARSTSLAARAGWVRLLEDLGLQGDFVLADDLPERLRGEPPRLLVLPASLALPDRTGTAIADYVAGGGVAVADGMLAFYDEHLVRRRRPALDDVFGLDRNPSDGGFFVVQGRPADAARLASGAAASERGVSADVCERDAGGCCVQCEHRWGQGLAVYLNLAVCEYVRVRLDSARVATARDLRRRVQRVLDAASVPPPVLVRGSGLPTCVERMLLTSAVGRQLLCVRLNALEQPRLLQTLGRRALEPVEIRFARPVRLHVLDEPQARPASATFSVDFDPSLGVFAEVVGL